MVGLAPATEASLAALFEEPLRGAARSLLVNRCTSRMAAPEGQADVEAVQAAVLRLSAGELDRLERAIELAEYHWPTVVEASLEPPWGSEGDGWPSTSDLAEDE